MVRPVLKWAGGKTRILAEITTRFPKQFGRYVEPFLGGGACFFNLDVKTPSLLSDLNPELIHFYRTLRDSPFLLMEVLTQYQKKYSKDFYYQVRDSRPRDPVRKAARTLFLNKTGFNGLYRQNAKGEFNVPFGKRVSCPKLFVEENFLAASQRLKNVELLCEDFAALSNRVQKDDLVYCDPPYAPLSKTSSFTSYTSAGFDLSKQRRLRDWALELGKRGAHVLISNSDTPHIRELYSKFSIVEILAPRTINCDGKNRQKVTEVLAIFKT